MKNFKKMITSAIAGLMAVTALATTAGAAEYYDIDGSCWTDCKYDGKVYVENSYGNYNDGYFVGHDVFLDDMHIPEVEQALNIKIRITDSDGFELLDAMLGIEY